jgi:hypothetical protein
MQAPYDQRKSAETDCQGERNDGSRSESAFEELCPSAEDDQEVE